VETHSVVLMLVAQQKLSSQQELVHAAQQAHILMLVKEVASEPHQYAELEKGFQVTRAGAFHVHSIPELKIETKNVQQTYVTLTKS